MNKSKLKLIVSVIILSIVVTLIYFLVVKKEPEPAAQNQSTNGNGSANDSTKNNEAFDKTKYSLTEPSSLWVIVNKKNPLPASYIPAKLTEAGDTMLREDAAGATGKLIEAAKKDGIELKIISGYRSYASQTAVYQGYVKSDGQANADAYSARPGHSEHQTGLAADLGNGNGQCDLDICFAGTAGGKWLATHASEYGFVIRYASDKIAVTGYQYEPWHIRYVGNDLSSEIGKTKQTLEEFFGLPAAPGY